MILFRPEHVEPILAGRKTQTRRLWEKPRVKVGSVHQARTTLFGKPFARLLIVEVRLERLVDMPPGDAEHEGYGSFDAFYKAFCRINGPTVWEQPVYAVTFEVVG